MRTMALRGLALALLALLALAGAERCGAGPGAGAGPRSPGDGHYRLLVNGDGEGYTPDKRYVVSLVGAEQPDEAQAKVQAFTRFEVWLEAEPLASPASPQRVGQFQLFADTQTRFGERCAGAVTQADDAPKRDAQLMWKAPPPGAGCVHIKAMVYENASRWFAAEGALVRRVCPVAAHKPDCCACDIAKYKMEFTGLWSPETHPKDFPTRALWLTHFSDVVGATHASNFSFWGEGLVATDGFRALAEWGSPGQLERELRQAGARGAIRAVVKAPGLWHPNVNGRTSAAFSVDNKRHRLSLVSMFGPSPDWVVGVSGLELCRADCSWEPAVAVDLYPYDAGTDSGVTYLSPNAETRPREKMYRITSMYPEDPRAPFYQPGGTMRPLARLTLARDALVPRACDERTLLALAEDADADADDDAGADSQCPVTAWGAWSACSVSCGKGLRMRARQYRSPAEAEARRCQRQLVAKEMCVAAEAECPEGETEAEVGASRGEAVLEADGAGDACATSAWGAWSACPAACGSGTVTRRRHFLDRMAAKRCPLVPTEESRECMESACAEGEGESEREDPSCPVTAWGAWSPCSATCGRGAQVRTRLLLVEADRQRACAARTRLVQQLACNDADCTQDMATAKRACMEQPEAGPCRGEFTRWAFVAMKGMCVPFPYGGCRGNRNNFLTQKECTDTCGLLIGAAGGVAGADNATNTDSANTGSGAGTALGEDCALSPWGEWTRCSATCGVGYQERTRTILRQPGPGGAPCPARLSRRRRCSRRC